MLMMVSAKASALCVTCQLTTLPQQSCHCLLAKMDIQSAYRMVPVHPDDHLLLGMQWEGQLFINTVLSFGLRSAPKIFNMVADELEWITHSRGAEHIAHYLDDLVVVGAPATNECMRSRDILMSACRELGVPIATHKCEGLSACLTFLVIEVDTQNLELRLPEEKLDRLKKLLVEWLPRKSCECRDLESLIGPLSQACKVVRPGRRFLRGMIQLSVAHKQHHHIRLNQSFRADLEWWHKFLSSWNGVSMIPASWFRSNPSILISRFGVMPQAHGFVLLFGRASGFKLAGKIIQSSWILQLLAKKCCQLQ